MPWDRWKDRGTVGELIEIARLARGKSIPKTIAAIAAVEPFPVRSELNRDVNDAPTRALAVTLTDTAIRDRIKGINGARLRRWESDADPLDPPSKLDLAILAVVFDYPIHFFYQTHEPRPEIIVHLNMKGTKPCITCGFIADYLCDYPLGNGKTCDANLCDRHAIKQGAEWEDLHFCRAHALIASGQITPPEE